MFHGLRENFTVSLAARCSEEEKKDYLWLIPAGMCTLPRGKGYNRLQNSPYFCVFKNAGEVKQKVWNEAENREQDWGETLSLAAHALRACEARALRARKTLTPRFTDFFTDFEKKPTVLQSRARLQ